MLTAARPVLNLLPHDVIARASITTPAKFSDWLGGRGALLVRVADAGDDLVSWLGEATSDSNYPAPPSSVVSNFRTEMTDIRKLLRRDVTPAAPIDATQLARRLTRENYFVAPLRKRGLTGKPFAHRISVGRARNNDIPLRDASVSKFHAFFECDENDVVFLSDASSVNKTSVGGTTIGREAHRLSGGDEVLFGRVVTIFCTPELLWEAITGGALSGGLRDPAAPSL